MKSSGTTDFWQRYRALPTPIREAARQTSRLWSDNPRALKLRFKTSLARRSLGEGDRPPWLAGASTKAAACHADLSRQSPDVGGSLGEGGTPEPKRIAIGLITQKGKLSPATEKFCQCAKDAAGG